jgi:hypothetical protein
MKNITPADPPEIGEQWVWIAFAQATKLVIPWRVRNARRGERATR